jgi:hypothetical protein
MHKPEDFEDQIIDPGKDFWQQDKIKHYDFCYNFVAKTNIFNFFWSKIRRFNVILGIMNVGKEEIHDRILKRGNYDLNDKYANLLGAYDGYYKYKKRYLKWQ